MRWMSDKEKNQEALSHSRNLRAGLGGPATFRRFSTAGTAPCRTSFKTVFGGDKNTYFMVGTTVWHWNCWVALVMWVEDNIELKIYQRLHGEYGKIKYSSHLYPVDVSHWMNTRKTSDIGFNESSSNVNNFIAKFNCRLNFEVILTLFRLSLL